MNPELWQLLTKYIPSGVLSWIEDSESTVYDMDPKFNTLIDEGAEASIILYYQELYKYFREPTNDKALFLLIGKAIGTFEYSEEDVDTISRYNPMH